MSHSEPTWVTAVRMPIGRPDNSPQRHISRPDGLPWKGDAVSFLKRVSSWIPSSSGSPAASSEGALAGHSILRVADGHGIRSNQRGTAPVLSKTGGPRAFQPIQLSAFTRPRQSIKGDTVGPRTAAIAATLEILALVLIGSSGCTAARLGQRTMNQANTLPELQYQQVLDNLAMFADNPSALPWHVNFREGTTQITDSLSGGRRWTSAHRSPAAALRLADRRRPVGHDARDRRGPSSGCCGSPTDAPTACPRCPTPSSSTSWPTS